MPSKRKPPEGRTESPAPGVEIKGDPREIAAYLGKWVAIVDGFIRASGENFGEAFDAAKANGLDDPEFMFLPKHAFVG
jgi:hypothetical protein